MNFLVCSWETKESREIDSAQGEVKEEREVFVAAG